MSELIKYPDWVTYFAFFEDAPAIISVDRKWRRQAAPVGMTRLFLISLAYKGVHNSGFPTETELRRLYIIEEAISARCEAAGRVYYLGKVTTAGRRYLYLYTTPDHVLPLLLERIMTDFPDQVYSFQQIADPEWTQYFQLLLPDEDQEQHMKRADDCAEAFSIRQGEGIVDHWFYFDRLEDGQEFAQAIQRLSFIVVHFERLPDQKPFPYLLIASKSHPIRGAEMERIVSKLEELASTHRGRYDGWDYDQET